MTLHLSMAEEFELKSKEIAYEKYRDELKQVIIEGRSYTPQNTNRMKLNDKFTSSQCEKVIAKAFPSESNQSFDSIIMECQDMLSIEDQVEKKYHKWLGVGEKRKIKWECDNYSWVPYAIICLVSACVLLFTPSIFAHDPRSPERVTNVTLQLTAWVSLFMSCAVTWMYIMSSSMKVCVINGIPKQKPSESSKFRFLKESYSGTITNLNTRLELVQTRISEQVRMHQIDREQIQEYSDMFGDTTDIVSKIDSAICDLQDSSTKLSEKKAEINKSLNEYIGERGVIAQKEREIERLKMAQELSDRMKTNFSTTMEITKNVDVLTDVIIPGLKQLMSLRIPELIEQVNYKCDTETAFLEISK